MLNSNQITLTLHGADYSEVCRLLQQRAALVTQVREFQQTDKSGSVHPNVAAIADIDKQTIHVLGKAALGKVLGA